jgi:hypothetical protein
VCSTSNPYHYQAQETVNHIVSFCGSPRRVRIRMLFAVVLVLEIPPERKSQGGCGFSACEPLTTNVGHCLSGGYLTKRGSGTLRIGASS